MAKPKTPLLSLSAHGTIGNTISFQRRGSVTIARKKPTPVASYTLPQAYQRWDYRDYAYLWTLESIASKQSYRTRASRYHITGFSLWMREHLRDLPNLAGRWHLDELLGSQALDSSRNSNTGTIIGASPAPGTIAGSYYFDGLNDMINCGNHISLLPEALTIELFLITPAVFQSIGAQSDRYFLSRLDYGNNRRVWGLGCRNKIPGDTSQRYLFILLGDPSDGSMEYAAYWDSPLSPSTSYHIAFTFDSGTLIFYVDGIPRSLTTTFGAVPSALYYCDVPLVMGCCLFNGSGTIYYKASLDNVALFNSALPSPLIVSHSTRHFP